MVNSVRTVMFLIAVVLLNALSAQATHITVSPAGEIQSIGHALRAAAAGDTVTVEPGIYREHNLTISQPLSLVGIDWPVVDAANKGPILEITASNVTVSGFEFRGTPVSYIREHAAVLLSNASRCTITGNRFRANFFAVYLAKSDHCRISRNDIAGSSTDLTASGNAMVTSVSSALA